MSEQLLQTEQPGGIDSISFAYQSARSLFHNIPDRVGVIYRPAYEENARTEEQLPLNVEGEMLEGFIGAIRDRGIQSQLLFRPYWNRKLRYDAAEVFGAAVQSVDLHDAPLPMTVLPPEEDVESFISKIQGAPHKVKLTEQLTTALDITDNDLLGAVNLCWIGTRFMGRGADQRAYPNIPMNIDIVRSWNSQLAQFETYSNSGLNDAPGDNYYFWTHVFGAMVFSEKGLRPAIGQLAFSKGTEIMAFVRKNIARKQPNITEHAPASELGRAIGLALANLDESNLS